MKRVIDTSFWTDDKVMDIFSPEDRYFFLYLMTNPHTTQLGIYAINKKYIALETGYSIESVKVLLDRFQNKYEIIKYSEATSEIAIKNYLRHSIVKGGKPIEDQITAEIKKVQDKSLLKYVHDALVTHDNLNASVVNVLSLLDVNVDVNVVSYHESYDDSSHDSSDKPKTSRFQKPSIEEIKAYCKERNNTVDPEKFHDFYESKGWYVGKTKMKDWRAAVRTWEKGEKEKHPDDIIKHNYDFKQKLW